MAFLSYLRRHKLICGISFLLVALLAAVVVPNLGRFIGSKYGSFGSAVITQGKFAETVVAFSWDRGCKVIIAEGTIGFKADGKPLDEITVVKLRKEPPPPPADSSVIGFIYDLGPDGAIFGPPITLTIFYNPEEIPEGLNEEDLVIAMWDNDASEWVNLVSTVDPATHTISALVKHFTAFGVLAYTRPATSTAVP